jgi:ribosomal protein L12E/L44/L45/RPP1/RPP2
MDDVELNVNRGVKRSRTRALDRTEWASVVREARDKLKGAAVQKKKKKKKKKKRIKKGEKEEGKKEEEDVDGSSCGLILVLFWH